MLKSTEFGNLLCIIKLFRLWICFTKEQITILLYVGSPILDQNIQRSKCTSTNSVKLKLFGLCIVLQTLMDGKGLLGHTNLINKLIAGSDLFSNRIEKSQIPVGYAR